jgi:hypothetical protein
MGNIRKFGGLILFRKVLGGPHERINRGEKYKGALSVERAPSF